MSGVIGGAMALTLGKVEVPKGESWVWCQECGSWVGPRPPASHEFGWTASKVKALHARATGHVATSYVGYVEEDGSEGL